MKLRLGPPPTYDVVSSGKNEWTPVPSPGSLKAQIMAGCIGLLMVAAIVIILSIRFGHFLDVSWPLVILMIFLIMPVHELLHALGCEGGWASKRITFGFYSKAFGFYTHYDGPIARNRYLIIAALPFLALTILPLIYVAVLQSDPIHLTEMLISNALASSMDVMAIILITTQVPARSILINSGMETLWIPTANKERK